MRIFGLEISRAKAAKPTSLPASLLPDADVWFPLIREPFAGAWQRNLESRADSILANSAIFRCISLIASDIAKLRIKLVQSDANGIWTETTAPAFSPVLKRPNDYQNRIQFLFSWTASKLIHGNAYILKQRDARNVVNALYVLNPTRVWPKVAPDGAAYYDLGHDELAGVYADRLVVPASEIIHDRINTLFHPLCGLSPIYAGALPAMTGQRIAIHSDRFFANDARPSGILTTPGNLDQTQADRIKADWELKFRDRNFGRVAVMDGGLKYEAMTQNATDAQLIEQLKWSAETVCAVFGVPPYKAGVGPMPTYTNVEALGQQYYRDALQHHIEAVELCLDEGLELPAPYGTELDLDNLFRMDTHTLTQAVKEAVSAGVMSPNEGRAKLGLGPTKGGESPYLQQQNFSIAALAERDANQPFAKPPPPPAPPPAPPGGPPPAPTPGAKSALAALVWAKQLERNGHAGHARPE